MARRAGGYRKSQDVEWAECARQTYGEAIVSAASMGQDVFTWMNDAIQHHAYRCEVLQAQARYQADELEASTSMRNTPDKNDPRYQVTRPKPEITRPAAEQGSGPTGRGRSLRP